MRRAIASVFGCLAIFLLLLSAEALAHGPGGGGGFGAGSGSFGGFDGGLGGGGFGGGYGAGGYGAGGYGGGGTGGWGGIGGYGAGGYGSTGPGGWGGIGGYGAGGYGGTGYGGWGGAGGYGAGGYGGWGGVPAGASAYNTFGGGGFGAGTILHNGYTAGAIGAGAYNGSPRTINGSQRQGLKGLASRLPTGTGGVPETKAHFVYKYANAPSLGVRSIGSGTARGLGHRGGLQHHVSRNPAYWSNRSYFFGYGSPFGSYLGYPWWWPGYGNRFVGLPWFAYNGGLGFGSLGYAYGYPYFAYQATFPGKGYGNSPTSAAIETAPVSGQLQDSLDYAGLGEIDFRGGKYAQAVQDWRHALVEDPQNGAIVLLLSQALFATGQPVEAAGALQAALEMLPEDKWGAVVTHYNELYPNIQAYTDQIRAVENLRDASPEQPALHLLLGYHFGYLGYPKQAVRELEKAIELSPHDEIAHKLYAVFDARLGPGPKPAEEVHDSPAAPQSESKPSEEKP
ncbi:MAG TPA: tetratricopeptide repeat protein [Pirellulales bacterium]|nr:tetratricopeptide repeat protein [Pirellulales bacterium]